MVKRGIALVVLAAAAVALLVYSQFRTEPLKVSGFVEAYQIRIGSRVGGRVEKVLVDEGALVKKGDTLVVLEPYGLLQRRSEAEAEATARVAEYEKMAKGFRPEEIAQAKSKYDQLAAELEKLQNGPRKQDIEAAQADVRLAEAQLAFAREKLARTERLVAQNAATQEELDQERTSLRVAQATLDARQQNLALLLAGTRPEEIAAGKAQLAAAQQAWLLERNGYRDEDVSQAKAALESAQAALSATDEQIKELTITAPLDAVVEAVDLRPGDMVTANAPVLSLTDTSRLWVRVYVPENHLDLALDQKVWVTIDSYPGRRFGGHITFIARQGEFTPSNVQTPEERSKQVFRVRVTLDDGLEELRPGMSADVWLESAEMSSSADGEQGKGA
jgi:membrane fusion protein YbhG